MNSHRADAVHRTPTGDSIAQAISNRDAVRNEPPYKDLAKDLAEAHARRPGLWNQDLEKVNKALHDKGLLPGLDIVGVKGQDLITRDKSGKVVAVDTLDLSRQRAIEPPVAGYKGAMGSAGRMAEINADGSGKYQVKAGDNSWTVSSDLLKGHGVAKPTDNQIANYIKELEKANGRKLDSLRPGQEIRFPAPTVGGDRTSLGAQRAEAEAAKAKVELNKDTDAALVAMAKFGHTSFVGNKYIGKDDIATAMKRNDLTESDRRGLAFLNTKFETLKDPNGSVYHAGIDKYKTSELANILANEREANTHWNRMRI